MRFKFFVLIFCVFGVLNADEIANFNLDNSPKNTQSIESSIKNNVNLWDKKNQNADVFRVDSIESNLQDSVNLKDLRSQDSIKDSTSKPQDSINLQDSKTYQDIESSEISNTQNTESNLDSTNTQKSLSKKEQKALEKEEKKRQKEQEKKEKQLKKEQEKLEKKRQKLQKSKKHITAGKNTQEVKIKRDFGILGSSVSFGASSETFDIKAAWNLLNEANQKQTFSTDTKMRNVGITWGYQYIGRKIHFVSDTRLNITYNLLKSDMDVMISGDELFGYYFPFNSFSGIALKLGGTFAFAFSTKELTEYIENKSVTQNNNITAFFGIGSKIGFEINVARVALGAYFTYYPFYLADFNGLNEKEIPLNFNANSKSGGYGFQAVLIYRFKQKHQNFLKDLNL